jgi:RimJ/RimL family protein N-acetyltransferase
MFISSELIDVRLTTEQDLDFVLAAEQDEGNRRFIGQWSRDKHAAAITDEDKLHLILQEKSGHPAGYVIITGLQDPNLNVCIMRIVVHIQGRGYGTKILSLLTEWVFNQTGTHRLWLDVNELNARARHVYEGAGFQVDGRLRESVKRGDAFETMLIMSILRQEYAGLE